jgi:C1A family cysteine protease
MNSKKLFFFLSVSFVCFQLHGQEFATGLIKENYDSNMVQLKMAPKTRAGLPSSYSLKKYTPSIGDQNPLGTCTSWAAAYCAMTIVKGVENGYQVAAFDPLDLHSRLKVLNDKDVCGNGNSIQKASQLLKSHGAKSYNYSSVCSYVSANKTYTSKLYDWKLLSISSYNFKYALSQENSPIVIACDYYIEGWHNNLSNGVWTGYYNSSTQDGAHAMVIIGYDDYKSGGAFLIQNSWGSNWGDGGYFWIKYSDVNKVIYQAIQYLPNPNKVKNQYDTKSTQKFRFYNNCSLTTYVTLSQDYGDGYITEGWYSIQPGSFTDLDITNREANPVYWMAVANYNGSKIFWRDDTYGTTFCYDVKNAHTISDDPFSDDYSCPNSDKFYKEEPYSRNTLVTQTLTCPNIKTRGGEEIKISETKVSELLIGEESNKNWNGKTDLLDPFSGNPIFPIKSESDSVEYDLYYLKDKEIVHFVGAKTDLIKQPYLKFTFKEYAEAYLKDKSSEK